tara:strand:+ start:7618 stop:7884 length:267 start_codon:yes stop_codon:yes gene_type:complete
MGRSMRSSVVKSRQVVEAVSNATNTNVTISEVDMNKTVLYTTAQDGNNRRESNSPAARLTSSTNVNFRGHNYNSLGLGRMYVYVMEYY